MEDPNVSDYSKQSTGLSFCVCVCSPASFHHPQGDDSSVDQRGFVLNPACQNTLALCLLLPETWLNQQINQFSLWEIYS
jgi:hypothetical protein